MPRAERAKIVFCEDDPMIQKVIRAALKAAPHDVHYASDGAEGLALIQRERPDVVFTDVSMPGLDGYGLVEALKQDPATADIPVVLMTASTNAAQIARAQQLGDVILLPKPFTMAELRRTVDDRLGR